MTYYFRANSGVLPAQWFGTEGDDFYSYRGSSVAKAVFAGEGNDQVYAGSGSDTIWGGSGHDWLFGGSGHDQIHGDDGNDVLIGEDGDDSLWGGNGQDYLDGGAGVDHLYGDAGNDTLVAHGSDHLTGGSGADRFIVRADQSTVEITDFKAFEGDKLDIGAGGTGAIFAVSSASNFSTVERQHILMMHQYIFVEDESSLIITTPVDYAKESHENISAGIYHIEEVIHLSGVHHLDPGAII